MPPPLPPSPSRRPVRRWPAIQCACAREKEKESLTAALRNPDWATRSCRCLCSEQKTARSRKMHASQLSTKEVSERASDGRNSRLAYYYYYGTTDVTHKLRLINNDDRNSSSRAELRKVLLLPPPYRSHPLRENKNKLIWNLRNDNHLSAYKRPI